MVQSVSVQIQTPSAYYGTGSVSKTSQASGIQVAQFWVNYTVAGVAHTSSNHSLNYANNNTGNGCPGMPRATTPLCGAGTMTITDGSYSFSVNWSAVSYNGTGTPSGWADTFSASATALP